MIKDIIHFEYGMAQNFDGGKYWRISNNSSIFSLSKFYI